MIRVEDNWDGVVFYCKDCEKVVQVDRAGRKFVYRCRECKTKNVAFGTEKSIANYFHVKEEEKEKKPEVKETAPAEGK